MAQGEFNRPLETLKVLDFSRVLAGPFAGRMLTDLGADVVKIEPPDGDSTRLWGKVVGGISGYYNFVNAGKRNVCIDLRVEGAQQLVFELVREADIVLENFRPDVMPRLGIGYDRLSTVNPRLIMLSISGFGRDGPESHRPAYAPIVHAETGLVSRTAERGGPMRDLPLSVADTNAGLHGLVALLAAVIQRERTGAGQHIDIAMLDATIACDDQLHYELDSSQATRNLPPDIWEAGAGAILVSVDFRYLWRSLTSEFGLADPAGPDAELAEKIAKRRAAAAEFMRSLTTWEAVETAMARMNLVWGRVRSGGDLRDQPTIAFRKSIVDIDDREGGKRPVAQSPYRFSAAQSGVRGPAPHRGEHNQEVLREWLGKRDEDVASLVSAGVLAYDAEHAPFGHTNVQ